MPKRMVAGFLIDTNTVIDAQMARLPHTASAFLAEIINQNFTISFVTYIEFLGYSDIAKSAEEFIGLADVIEIDKIIIDNCIKIRKAHKIKLPDAIIAATAISLGYTLITRNTSDFKDIVGLNTIDLHAL